MFWCAQAQAQSSWLHVSGMSWHDQAGYNGSNPGLGFEIRTDPKWSVAGGTYRNSFGRTTWYGMTKYHWYRVGDMQINANIGAVTGYGYRPAAPIVLPELCYQWMCLLGVPRVGPDTTSALALYLRIPIR